MRRRDFLHRTALAPLALAVPAVYAQPAGVHWDRVLVLVELRGGNDGLNTVVPYHDEQYYRLRPQLAVPRQSVLQLSEHLGFHPAFEPLMPLWQARELAVILGVGYPNPNRSHFRSIEIWDTASNSNEVLQEGWIARLFATHKPPATFAADGIALGLDPGPLSGASLRTITMRQPQQFLDRASRVQPTAVSTANPALAHILAVQNELSHAATRLQDKLIGGADQDATFPATPIGRQLQVVAQLLTRRTPVAVFKVSHGSFDTHSNQRNTHDRLLHELAEALVAFRQTLQTANLWQQVLLMTYAEFGRRAAENGSTGTDHGTAAPHFLLGGQVRGGLYGQQPTLTNLTEGDLRHVVDYRSLYMTVARRWWGMSGDFLQGRNFPLLDCLA
jgi:uncharacterized protein (DUF1501 family)